MDRMRTGFDQPEVQPLPAREEVVDLTSSGPTCVHLSDPLAASARLTGAKASNLALAAAAGLPVLPGFVITTIARQIKNDRAIEAAWKELTSGGRPSLVVRSSSTSEDGSTSSMAGMFTSVLDVRGWDAFLSAVEQVRASAPASGGEREIAPMAVLVQPMLHPRVGGILFGLDPVSGATDRLTVVVAEGGPDGLVSGRVEGHQYALTSSGRIRNRHDEPSILTRNERRALAQLSKKVVGCFGGPQDVEWGLDHDGRLYLFQSRPVTAVGSRGSGPVLGPGPVAETFPDPLSALETDLWVSPLREAVAVALAVTGAAGRRGLERSPLVTTVKGRVAADLGMFGMSPQKRSLWQRIDPVPPARRLAAAWRVGRLKAALPSLALDLVATVDADLGAVPDLRELSNEQLLNVLVRSRRTLVSLHGYEVLSGLLDPDEERTTSGAALALRSLAIGRAGSLSDAELIAGSPQVLALTPPAIAAETTLPAGHTGAGHADGPSELGAREMLRLRIRWVQELSARSAWELGKRMVPAGKLTGPEQISCLDLDEVRAIVHGGGAPADLSARGVPDSAPLPAAFRLNEAGDPVPLRIAGDPGGKGAGGGRGMGRVHHGTSPPHGSVLVVRTLDPGLAPLLPALSGLVSETGNVLSHLAILAREFGVPTVINVPDALERYPEDSVVVVDGSTGEVSKVEEA